MVWYFIKQVFLSYKEHCMVAWRYEIFLLVLKKIIHSFAALTHEIFFNTRREVSYPRARPCSILYFCYRREQSCREHAKWFCKYVANFPHFVLNSIFICRWQPSSGKARYLLIKLQLKSYSIYHNFLTPLLVKGIFFLIIKRFKMTCQWLSYCTCNLACMGNPSYRIKKLSLCCNEKFVTNHTNRFIVWWQSCFVQCTR